MATRYLKWWIVDSDLLFPQEYFSAFWIWFAKRNRFLGKYGKDGLFKA